MKNDDTQEEQEVLQAGPLDNMEKVDPMTAKELQDCLEALSPDQQEAHRQRADQSAWRLVEAFDPGDAEESIAEAVNNTAQAVSRLAAELDAALSDAMHSEADTLRAAIESLRESLLGIDKKMVEAQEKITAFCDSEAFNKLGDMLPGFREWYNAFMDCEIFDISPGQLICLGDFTEEAQSLLPFIQKEIEARREGGADQLTAAEFFRDKDPDTGEPVESIYGRVRQRAREWAALPPLEPLGGQAQECVIPNDLLTGSLVPGKVEQIVNKGPFDLPLIGAGKPTEVTAFVNVTLPKKFEQILGLMFEGALKSTLIAAVSLMASGRGKFTAEEVLRQMYAKARADDCYPKTVKEVDNLITILCNTEIDADMESVIERLIKDRKEREKRKNPKESPPILISDTIKEHILMLVREEKRYGNGETVYEYTTLRNPDGSIHQSILLDLSESLGQVIRTNISALSILETKNGKPLPNQYYSMNLRRVAIRDYLFNRIAVMKNDQRNKRKKQNHSILFETLYTRTGIDEADKGGKQRAREFTFACLDYWKATGLIADYEIEMKGRRYRSIIIRLKKRG